MLFCLSFTVTSFQTIVLKSFPSFKRRESECQISQITEHSLHYLVIKYLRHFETEHCRNIQEHLSFDTLLYLITQDYIV